MEVVEYCSMELDSLIKAKNIRLSREVKASSSLSMFDRERMIQVVVNLLSNAIKFSPKEGEIFITIFDDILPDGQHALGCCVADQGTGIPPDELQKVFDKFAQSSKTKTGAGGTGLGLSICREIVEAHGGKIWAEGGHAKGAVLKFLIPKGEIQSIH